MKDDFYVPALGDIALQSADNKQGRGDALDAEAAEQVRSAWAETQKAAYAAYAGLIDKGLARELARINLPLSLYSEWYWQIDLHNLFHFLGLRLDAHAQKEIRAYAEVIFGITKKVAPLCCASFERRMLNSVTFSAEEFAEIKRRLNQPPVGEVGDLPPDSLLAGKELERFEEKLKTGKQR
jgi:thymidylate synthase (FAD)